MQYAIELYYDEDTENKLFQLSEGIADKKISTKFLEWKTRPHLTLACFNDVDELLCIEKIKKFAVYYGTFAVLFLSGGFWERNGKAVQQ